MRTFLFTLDAMISLLVCTRPSTACAAPFVTLKVWPLGALMVASVLCICSHVSKDWPFQPKLACTLFRLPCQEELAYSCSWSS